LHALEALGQAAVPDMPLTRVLRLRGSAVSLSREANKAERRLQQLRKARRAGIPAEPQPAPEPAPKIEKAFALIADTKAVAALANNSKQTWTQAYHQRQRDQRLARRTPPTQPMPLGATAI